MLKTHESLIQELANYKSPKSKLTTMIKSGEVCLLKRGCYSTSKYDDPFAISAFLFPLSYVSFETALSLYGLIPEAVYAVTCAGRNLKKEFSYSNYRGNYIYRYIPSSVFALGTEYVENETGGYFLAKPEKAFCDLIYKKRVVRTLSEVPGLLFDDIRFDEDIFELDWDTIERFAKYYHCTSLNTVIAWRKKNAGKDSRVY